MATIAVDPDETREYTLKGDETDGPVFTLGVLDSLTRAYIDDQFYRSKISKKVTKGKGDTPEEATANDETETNVELSDVEVHRKHIEFVRFGLKGWKGFKTASGADVPFELVPASFPGIGKRQVVSDACLKRLSLTTILILGTEISHGSRVSEDDRKSF